MTQPNPQLRLETKYIYHKQKDKHYYHYQVFIPAVFHLHHRGQSVNIILLSPTKTYSKEFRYSRWARKKSICFPCTVKGEPLKLIYSVKGQKRVVGYALDLSWKVSPPRPISTDAEKIQMRERA